MIQESINQQEELPLGLKPSRVIAPVGPLTSPGLKPSRVIMPEKPLPQEVYGGAQPMVRPPEKKTGIGKQVLGGLKEAGEHAVGLGEAAVSGASGLIAFAPAFAAGLLKKTFGKDVSWEEAIEFKAKVSSLLTHEPITEKGKMYTDIVMSPFGVLGAGIEEAEKLAPETPGMMTFIAEALLLFGGPKVHTWIKQNKPIALSKVNELIKRSKAPPEVKAKVTEVTKPLAKPKPEVKMKEPGVKLPPLIKSRKVGEKTPPTKGVEFKYPEGDIKSGMLPYGAKLPQKVSNIRIDKLDSIYDMKKTLADTAAVVQSQSKKFSRGKVPWAETERLAEELGLSVEKMKRARKGKAYSAHELEAMRQLNAAAIEQLIKQRDKYIFDPSDMNLIEARVSLERAGALTTIMSGATAEAGRALNILKKKYKPGELKFEAMERILRELGGREHNQDLIKRLSTMDLENPLAVNKFLREVIKARTSDKVFEAWVNGLLSGPHTHLVNNISNTIMLMDKLAVSTGAALLEAPKALLKKPRNVYFGESPSKAFGMLSGVSSGVKKALFAFANEMTMEGASKIEVRHPTAIKGVKGKVVRVPGRALIAEDEFFKAILYDADIHSLAYKKATMAGLKGQKRIDMVAKLIQDPTDNMRVAAFKGAAEGTFTNELGRIGKSLSAMRETIPGARYIVPFLRVSINIPKQALRRTPLNFPRIAYMAAKGTLKGEALSNELAMAGIGTLTSIAIFQEVIKGNVTGGAPEKKAERESFDREGKQAYSVNLGNKWFSYERLEPLGTIMGIAADAKEVWDYATGEERDKLAQKIVATVTENIANKTFMRGVSTMLRAISDPERGGQYFIESLTGSVVPVAVASTTRAIDPNIRDARGIIDNIKARIPKLSEQLPIKRDIYGEPKQREGALAYRLLSPIWVKSEKTNPVDMELKRLDIHPGDVSRLFGGKKLSKEHYERLAVKTGQTLFKTLDALIRSDGYKKLPDIKKAKIIKSLISSVRKITRVPFYKDANQN